MSIDLYYLSPHEKQKLYYGDGLSDGYRYVENKIRGFYGIAPRFAGENHWPGHNFTGPGTKIEKRLQLGQPYDTPVDAVDACAKKHDIDYLNIRNKLSAGQIDRQDAINLTRQSDDVFINCVEKSKPKGVNGKLAQYIVGDIIKGKKFLENAGVIDPLRFTIGKDALLESKEPKEPKKNGAGIYKIGRTKKEIDGGFAYMPILKIIASTILPPLVSYVIDKIKNRHNK